MTALKPKALVTGGSGFIGSHLVERLANLGFAVHVATRRQSRSHNVHALDITDAAAVRAVLRTIQPQHIFHLAASNIMSGKLSSVEDVIKVNFAGTYNLLEAATEIPIESFVMTGSFVEYGAARQPVRETDRCEPAEIYAVSKLSATLLGQSFARTKGLPVVTFRVFTPYGPGVQKGRFVHEAIRRALANEPIPVSTKDNTRDFIYVDDVCELLIEGAARAGDHAGQIFNLGSGRKTSLEDFIALIVKGTNSKSLPQWNAYPDLPYDANSWQADMTKTFGAFAWRPRVAITDGIGRTTAWLSAVT